MAATKTKATPKPKTPFRPLTIEDCFFSALYKDAQKLLADPEVREEYERWKEERQ